jgi:hypothetical protein
MPFGNTFGNIRKANDSRAMAERSLCDSVERNVLPVRSRTPAGTRSASDPCGTASDDIRTARAHGPGGGLLPGFHLERTIVLARLSVQLAVSRVERSVAVEWLLLAELSCRF